MAEKMNIPRRLKVIEEEKELKSKTGNNDDCEDSIYISESFIAVIDGATIVTGARWGQKTNGQVAVEIISKAFAKMPFDYTIYQATDMITEMINDHYNEGSNLVNPPQIDLSRLITASFVVISVYRQEVWLVGDCQFLLGNLKYSNEKKVDQILANVRSLYLELEILNGATIEELRQYDPGRKYIEPLLKKQLILQNNLASKEYWYPVVDGSRIPREGIIVKTIPEEIDTIVLATDGYPILKNTLEESEKILQEILDRDPLLFREYNATKGLVRGNISFDDRAFIKVRLERY